MSEKADRVNENTRRIEMPTWFRFFNRDARILASTERCTSYLTDGHRFDCNSLLIYRFIPSVSCGARSEYIGRWDARFSTDSLDSSLFRVKWLGLSDLNGP